MHLVGLPSTLSVLVANRTAPEVFPLPSGDEVITIAEKKDPASPYEHHMPDYEQRSAIASEMQVREFTADLNSGVAATKCGTYADCQKRD